MNTDKEVVLDRAGLIQLAGGMVLLLVLGFTAGAVVGFGVHGDAAGAAPVPASVTDAVNSVTKASNTEPCVPAEPLGLSVADAGTAADRTPARATPAVGAGTADVAFAAPAAASRPGVTTPRTFTVTAPAATPAEDTPTAPVPTPLSPLAERYAVQLGVFGVEANADRLAARLRKRGYDPLVAAMRNRSGQWMRRVSLAVYDSEAEAELAARAFKDREGMPAVVVAFREDDR